MRESLARRIVRSHPRAWRARYEQEMLALLEASPGHWRTVVDLARGCASEWVRSSRNVRDVLAIVLAIACVGAAKLAASSIWGPATAPPGGRAWFYGICGVLAVVSLRNVVLRTWHFLQIREGRSDPPRPFGSWLSVRVLFVVLFVLDTLSRGAAPGFVSTYWDLRGWIDLDTVMMMGVFVQQLAVQADRDQSERLLAS